MSRRFQFSLRALLVVTLVVAAFFGGTHFGEYRERQRLAAARAEIAASREAIYVSLKWMYNEGVDKGLDVSWLKVPSVVEQQVDEVYRRAREGEAAAHHSE